jgi:acyl-CoA synthetase (AMP-forming)/AMP-acid ligase II
MGFPREPLFPASLLAELARAPELPAFEHGDRVVTRGELLDLVRRLAGGLRGAGLGPGRGVALVTGVTPEAFAAQIAAHVLGCRVAGVRPGYPPAQLAGVLTGADAIITDPASATDLTTAANLAKAARPTGAGGMAGAGGPVPVFTLGPAAGGSDLLGDGGAGGSLVVGGRGGDVGRLIYTSGSTGLPKGCAQTYRALTDHWAWQPAAWTPLVRELSAAFRRCLVFGTLASPVVLDYLGICLLGGGTGVIPVLDPHDRRPLFPHVIERYRITGTIMTVPRLYQLLDVLAAEPVDVSSLRAVMVSGSPVNPRRLLAARQTLGPVVYQGYGQSEAGLIAVLTPADLAEDPAAAASVGRPIVPVRVADGEIEVRSPYQMTGYWGDGERTAEVLREDGWLRTRDRGHLDDRGLLHLTGRSRDIIIVQANVVYAGPIERVLAGHPDVDEAYVVGAPDETTGEAVHAFVVPADGRSPDPAVLSALVRAELGEASVPATLAVVDGVPVAPSGKPDKRALLTGLLDGHPVRTGGGAGTPVARPRG